ncbi:MAG TPA: TIGR02996 domain-containing protein [Kofleriaceae bacterium]|nr:TIGR02996 domain-containing protein [Kofleriaceae bacterium]
MTSAANDAAARGDWAACLSALLAMWRTSPAPELAALIDRVAERCAAPECAPTTAAIKKRIATATDTDITPILATILRQARVTPSIMSHAIALAQRGRDPRIATLLAHFVEHYPYRHEAGELDAKLLDALVAIDDPRYRKLVLDAADAWTPRRGRFVRRRPRIDHLIARAAELRTRQPPPPFTDPTIASLLDQAPAHSTDVDTLLDAVYADLANDAPRAIYADALQDAGDPRGEFITLQLTNPGTRREKQLLRDHERAWLGSADSLVQKSGLAYRRGFVAAARLSDRALGAGPTDRVWQTIEELDVCSHWGEPFARWLPTLRSLRHVAQLYAKDLPYLGPVPWRSLGLRYANRNDLTHVTAERFPVLELLDLSTMEPLDAAHFTSLGMRPRRIRIRAVARREVAPLDVIAPEVELVRKYEFRSTAESIVVRGTHATLVYRTRDVDLGYLTGLLARLPVKLVRLETPPDPTIEPAQRAALDRTLAEHAMTWETPPASTARPAP